MAKASTKSASPAVAAGPTKFVFVTRGNYAGQFLQLDEAVAAAATDDQWGISTADGAPPTGFDTSIPDGWDTSPFNLPQSLVDYQNSVVAEQEEPEPEPAPAPEPAPKPTPPAQKSDDTEEPVE